MTAPSKPDDSDESQKPTTTLSPEQAKKITSWARSAVRKYFGRGRGAEDVVQHTLILIHRNNMRKLAPDFWENDQRARAYVTTLVRHIAVALLDPETQRKRSRLVDKRKMDKFVARSVEDAPGLTADMRKAIAILPKDDGVIIEMMLSGKSSKEVGEALGMTALRVQRRYDRALSKLRDALMGDLTAAAAPQVKDTNDAVSFPDDPAAEMEGIELYIDPGDASEKEVRAVLRALNELHKAAGGLGLDFHVDGTFVIAREEVPA
jgi:RNA polymerase sigma factor (sigma-70 family)